MNQAIPWSIAGGVLVAAAAALVVAAPQRKDPAFDFIAGNRPVTEDQVRQKLVSDGWSDIQIVVRGRYFMATASKDGQSDAFAVDSLTGRLRGERPTTTIGSNDDALSVTEACAERTASYPDRRDGYATYCDSVGAGCFSQRQHLSTSSTNQGLQIMPRVSAGLSEKSYAGCLQ
jgi:hypothetical protein